LEPVLDEYFSLTTKTVKVGNDGIILGNVQLAEDRFPPVLLTFRTAENCNENQLFKPKTGFEHDAVFYFEAEKPLHNLVTQRRRWINGSYIAVYWVLMESWIRNAGHGWLMKSLASLLLFVELAQGAIVRLFVPSTIACGIMFMVTIIPSISRNDVATVQEIVNGGDLDDPVLLAIGACAALVYLFVFAVFMFAHTPRAVPVQDDDGDIQWQCDTASAYRPKIFLLAFLVNAAAIMLFIYVGVGIFVTVGWGGAPNYFKALCVCMGMPYLVALLDGLVNSAQPNIRAFRNLIVLYPVFILSAIWFYVWLPCYASARISDLSWGNRGGTRDSYSSSEVARHRAYIGRIVSVTIVLTNVLVTGVILALSEVVSKFTVVVLFTVLAINAFLLSVNLLDIIYRLLTKKIPRVLFGKPPPPITFIEDSKSAESTNSEPSKYIADGEDEETIVTKDDVTLVSGDGCFYVC
jgi:hypothetical protein